MRSMLLASSDTNINAASTGDRNGGIAKVPPTQVVAHDVPAGQVAAARATVSQPAVQQRWT